MSQISKLYCFEIVTFALNLLFGSNFNSGFMNQVKYLDDSIFHEESKQVSKHVKFKKQESLDMFDLELEQRGINL